MKASPLHCLSSCSFCRSTNILLSERKKSLQNYRAHVSKLQRRPYHCHQSSTKPGSPLSAHASSDSCTPWGRWSAPASLRTAHTPVLSPPNWTSAQRTDTCDQAETKSFRIILTLTLHHSKVTWHSKSFHFGIVTSEQSIPRKNTNRYCTISEYIFQNMKEIVQRKSENMDPSNQQTKLSMLRCRLASDWSEIVKNMSYRVRQQTSRPF